MIKNIAIIIITYARAVSLCHASGEGACAKGEGALALCDHTTTLRQSSISNGVLRVLASPLGNRTARRTPSPSGEEQ